MGEGWGRRVQLVLTMPEVAPVAPGPDPEECIGRKRAARYGLLALLCPLVCTRITCVPCSLTNPLWRAHLWSPDIGGSLHYSCGLMWVLINIDFKSKHRAGKHRISRCDDETAETFHVVNR